MRARGFLFALLLSTLAAIVTPAAIQQQPASSRAAAAGGTACDKLTALQIPNVTVKSATFMAEGTFKLPGRGGAADSDGDAPASAPRVPAFCRVIAVATPTDDSVINFEVWLPPADRWNGKFNGVGNGGYSGAIGHSAMIRALNRGYATASTDTGHTGGDMTFGAGHPEKVKDWAYRAIHEMTDAAKLIIRNGAGKFPEHSYFTGCSTGGHQALSEAQRFPLDYDGIVAGDPASNRIRQTVGFLWSWLATHDEQGTLILPAEKLPMITAAAVAACDTIDGLTDGLIDDPRKCHFDPVALLCKSGDGPSCLTQPQVDAVRKVYDGARSPRTGEQLFSGWPRGSEGFNTGSWRTYITAPREPMRVDLFRTFLFHNPDWHWRTIDWDRDLAYAEQRISFMSAVDRDLRPFRDRGGKLLMYTGWADPVVPAPDTAAYYEAVADTMGGVARTKEFFRFFAAPGMGHCSGGYGPNTFDALAALEQWVEKGIAPDTLLATQSSGGKATRSRPLCTYPQVARYRGTGSVDDAASFRCVNP
jgi:feruloyl esterase